MRRIAASLALVFALGAPSRAGAFCLRIPQVPFASGTLQGELNAWDGGINVLTDQRDAQRFESGFSTGADYVMEIKLAVTSPGLGVGLYDIFDPSPMPALVQGFPAATTTASYALVLLHFTGNGTVSLFDPDGVLLGQTTFSGLDRTHFGFYVQSAAGVIYSQDARNGGAPQALTYGGTGNDALDSWICFAAMPYAAATSRFADVVLDCYAPFIPCGTTPVRTSTWGRLKAAYR